MKFSGLKAAAEKLATETGLLEVSAYPSWAY